MSGISGRSARERQRLMRSARESAAAFGLALCLAAGIPGAARAEPAPGLQELTDEELSAADFEEEELTNEELDALMERYFQGQGAGTADMGETISEKISDPVLTLSRDADGSLRYTLPNGSFFLSTAAQGMISSEPVDMALPAGSVAVASHDDQLNVLPEAWHFSEEGSYHIKILSFQSSADGQADYNVYEVNFYFTIAGREENCLGAVPAPEGFAITQAWLDGRPIPVESDRCLFLGRDGRYEITYEDRDTGQIRLETVLCKDTTAPFLTFSQDPGGQELLPPLEFYPSEPGCRVRLSYNGSKGYMVGNSLTAAGNYELSVEDGAGNARSYRLRIRQTYDLFDRRIFIGGGLVAAALLLRVLFLRRHMRVL